MEAEISLCWHGDAPAGAHEAVVKSLRENFWGEDGVSYLPNGAPDILFHMVELEAGWVVVSGTEGDQRFHCEYTSGFPEELELGPDAQAAVNVARERFRSDLATDELPQTVFKDATDEA